MGRERRVAPVRRGLTPRALLTVLADLRSACLEAEREYADLLAAVRPCHADGARNLVHYVALRRHDLREVQLDLAALGVSSLGRCEANVVGTLDAVIAVLRHLAGDRPTEVPRIDERGRLLQRNADALLGPAPTDGSARIMVTLPSSAARDLGLVGDLVAAGMNTARLNCAHDDPATWRAMATNVRDTARRAGRPVRISADLAGPKLRTGAFGPGLPVVRVAPERDERGRVVAPAQLVLCGPDEAGGGLGTGPRRVPVTDADWLEGCRPGDVVWIRDARDAARRLTVVACGDEGVVVSTRRTVYLETGITLERRGGDGAAATAVGPLPATEPYVRLRVGDEFLLVPDAGGRADLEARPPRVPCSLPEVLDHAHEGHTVWFDDGKIGAVVVGRRRGGLLLRVTRARPSGTRLRGGKGINLPDTDLPIPGLTAQDARDLADLVDVVDAVGVSFVRSAADVELVQRRLHELGADALGVIVKVETSEGFRRLPEILLTAMRSAHTGVMIARGDLAVEVGFERLAEVQEEILWLCEAAHLPVVWATQVLDQLARTGRPSRAEITDVVLGARAECIMLNKGAHVVEAMATLRDVESRMRDHQDKKRAMLRRLRAWDDDRTPRPRRAGVAVPRGA